MSSTKPSLDDLRIERPGRSESRTRLWPVLVVLLLVMLVGAGAWWFRRPKPVAVRTVAARELSSGGGPVERTVLNASGYVTARREATVSSKVTGKVIEVLVEEGFRVKEGQVLARLDDTNVRASLKVTEAQLTASKAALAETKARIKEAELSFKRISSLASNNISAQAELEHAEADLAALNARLAQQEAEVTVGERSVASWQQQLEDTVIRAPFSGIVTTKNAQPGEMISPVSAGGGFTRTGICTLVDMDSLEIEIDVNESYINRVQPSQPVEATLDAYQDWKIPCKVIAIIPTADRQKSTVKVRVGFVKLDPRILPEMSVKVAFREAVSSGSAPVAKGVSVPKSALQEDNGRQVVLVVQNNRTERRAVTVASIGVDDALISAGIAAGERVITDAPPGLPGNTLVKEMSQN
jgi:HlyD family secretion protein